MHKVFLNETVLMSGAVPRVFQSVILGTFSIYLTEADIKIATGVYKSRLSTFRGLLIILRCLYFPNYAYLLQNNHKKP